ncbi:unnamed protein product [Vitrella brassicaformis CCMP3155]|uniref:TERF2-interacting telomeric protein 1 Myb domain-containing protein n=3 Tax=Vitrella brassicaformis TaxID=1169539 RepID=A0A0G4E8L3_VITBC|nr:unnamed protein product [Vitrella brassicaformis CCMP3155]|eukprot:CEL91692.1 unnamed protein product [Vitrella brassicaformis CCMP3155]
MSGRRPYTEDEDLKIAQYILTTQGGPNAVGLKGNEVWQEAERKKILNRTWQSMRERCKKHILPNFAHLQAVLLKGPVAESQQSVASAARAWEAGGRAAMGMGAAAVGGGEVADEIEEPGPAAAAAGYVQQPYQAQAASRMSYGAVANGAAAAAAAAPAAAAAQYGQMMHHPYYMMPEQHQQQYAAPAADGMYEEEFDADICAQKVEQVKSYFTDLCDNHGFDFDDANLSLIHWFRDMWHKTHLGPSSDPEAYLAFYEECSAVLESTGGKTAEAQQAIFLKYGAEGDAAAAAPTPAVQRMRK